ncbi:MAG: hypothetical protein C4522_15565 [Desulfobacteraceae bacterium]|nr:MAG: hypothetical protein C4522_15565 [Desulfobacteraceae bacterium]
MCQEKREGKDINFSGYPASTNPGRIVFVIAQVKPKNRYIDDFLIKKNICPMDGFQNLVLKSAPILKIVFIIHR